MNDIGKELYERVRADFERRLKSDKRPPKDMRGVSDYSARVGRYLAEAIAANVTEDALPDGRLYYNIAESILEPSLRTNYELVNDTAAEVQRLLDERQGLRIKPARADYPEERVHAVIGAASEEGIEFGKALRRMTSPAENITQSFADDFMQANAAQRSRAGFDTFIERQGGLNCCPWCAGLVGVFAYPKGLPKEVFARHDNCTCSVTYGTKGGARQNVWAKAKWNVPPIEDPHRMTADEAAEKGAFDKPRRLTGDKNRGILNLINLSDEILGRSIGAKAKTIWVRMPDGTQEALIEGSKITNKKIIAGKGRDRQIDIEDLLNYKHPEATPGEWVKIKGIGSLYDEYGEERKAELHWYENPTVSGKVDLKLKPRNGALYIDDD